MPLIWREVLLDAKNAQAEEVMTRDDEQENDQCPSSHPYAFNYGKDCCENKKLLHFGSITCHGSSKACGISNQPCLNHNYMKYGCYLENVDIADVDLADIYKQTSTFDECADFAKTVAGATGFIWTRDWVNWPNYCHPKSTDQILAGKKGLISWVAMFDCM